MRILTFLHQLIVTPTGMEPEESEQLKSEAYADYMKVLDKYKQKKAQNDKIILKNEALVDKDKFEKLLPYTLKEKCISFCELWYVRYFLGVTFLFARPALSKAIKKMEMEEKANSVVKSPLQTQFEMFQQMQVLMEQQKNTI